MQKIYKASGKSEIGMQQEHEYPKQRREVAINTHHIVDGVACTWRPNRNNGGLVPPEVI